MTRKRSRGPRPHNPSNTINAAAQAARARAEIDLIQRSNMRAFAQYDAARNGRRLRGWNAPGSGPNLATAGLETIRNRTRDAGRNDWSAAASIRSWTTNLVGTGIMPRPRTANAALKKTLIDTFEDWAPDADADGVLDFYGLQTLVTRNWLMSGEVFVRRRSRRLDEGLDVPLQLQVMESDLVPLFDADTWPELPAGHRIRSGIEINAIGKRVAYWVYRQHPGDGARAGSIHSGQLFRIPAENMLHIFEPLRAGQLRGVSDLAGVLAKLRGVADFDDAVLERQRLSNLFALFLTRAPGGPSPLDVTSGQPETEMPGGLDVVRLEPGLVQELAPGEDVRFSEPPDAGATYAEFLRGQHLGIAAGQGLPYELLTGDLKDVSDRTLRIVLNEFHRHCEQRQWQVLIPMFCRKVWRWWLVAAVLGGRIKLRDTPDARVDWAPQAWAYIHPVQDVQAKRIEVEAGFRARSQVIAASGEDPEEVDLLREQDAARDKRIRPTGAGG